MLGYSLQTPLFIVFNIFSAFHLTIHLLVFPF